ncbi:hypothetical protein JCM11641_006858 [Rhodosporidiobolus odoratus]
MRISLGATSVLLTLFFPIVTAKRPHHAGAAVAHRTNSPSTLEHSLNPRRSASTSHPKPHAKRKRKHKSKRTSTPSTVKRAVATKSRRSTAPAAADKPKKKTKRSRRHKKRASTTYTLTQQSLGGYSFFDQWDFFTAADPTHGSVDYVSSTTAWANGLVYVPDSGRNSTVMRIDSWSNLTYGANRQSVRISSKEKFTFGSIVVADLAKIPFGPTVWPAIWTLGDNWPNGGEIDIVEGVHDYAQNQMTLHTAQGCMLKTPLQAVGSVLTTDCNANINSNTGCGVQDPSQSSFGSAFNAKGGGVFALKWDEDGVAMYFFQRDSIPSDLSSGSPNPSSWGLPRAKWDAASCNPQQYFADQTIVINLTIGGDWAGATYNAAGYPGDWRAAVQDPKNYIDAAFEINSIKVYQQQKPGLLGLGLKSHLQTAQ